MSRSIDVRISIEGRPPDRHEPVASAPPARPAAGPAARPVAPPATEPYALAIPGTTETIEMVPVPRDAGGAPLWVARTEITWDVFDVFVYRLDEPAPDVPGDADAVSRPSKPYISMDRGFGHAGYPAISMTPSSAQQFCAWLSATTGCAARLPTVAEFDELCRRSGIPRDELDAYAWYAANAERTTHRVGTRSRDALGLADLLGNAAEWCLEPGGAVVACGGSYRDDAGDVGCAARVRPEAAWNASDPQIPKSIWWYADAGFVGFRIVCDAAGPAKPGK